MNGQTQQIDVIAAMRAAMPLVAELIEADTAYDRTRRDADATTYDLDAATERRRVALLRVRGVA
ncbi:hypothetical protein ACN9MB_13270 [Dyella kyungheensis]|uniref:hypothetical protein n=1 Tax=Dyella kyungheensis TaxID=1242174 RepID=UPI003CEF9964